MGLNSLIKAQPLTILTPEQCLDLIRDTAELLNQNKLELQLLVKFSIDSFNYQPKTWKKSTVSLYVSNFNLHLNRHPAEAECRVDLAQVSAIHELAKHFRKESPLQNATNTKQYGETAKGEQECCICLDNKASTMLPCGHSYCAVCTSKYIIEQEQHRCPQCRRQFVGNKHTLKREFYEVIQHDRVVYEQAREQILQVLARSGGGIVSGLREELRQLPRK